VERSLDKLYLERIGGGLLGGRRGVLGREESDRGDMTSDQPGSVQIDGGVGFAIPHMVVRAQVRAEGNRTLYPVGGDVVRVEEYAAHLLRNAGFSVYKGDDAHLFFSVLSCNFKDSFFREVCRNIVGDRAEERIARLDGAVSQAISNGVFDEGMIDEAEGLLLRYYESYQPERDVHVALANHMRAFDRGILLRLAKFYRRTGYTTKGAPDLFAVSGEFFVFVEVKSHTDSLSAAQYDFLQGYVTSVGNNILVLRVVPGNGIS
jgi:hypothetical protein